MAKRPWAVVLGIVAHFSPLTALPSAVFSLWHNISGAIVAAWLARRPLRDA